MLARVVASLSLFSLTFLSLESSANRFQYLKTRVRAPSADISPPLPELPENVSARFVRVDGPGEDFAETSGFTARAIQYQGRRPSGGLVMTTSHVRVDGEFVEVQTPIRRSWDSSNLDYQLLRMEGDNLFFRTREVHAGQPNTSNPRAAFQVDVETDASVSFQGNQPGTLNEVSQIARSAGSGPNPRAIRYEGELAADGRAVTLEIRDMIRSSPPFRYVNDQTIRLPLDASIPQGTTIRSFDIQPSLTEQHKAQVQVYLSDGRYMTFEIEAGPEVVDPLRIGGFEPRFHVSLRPVQLPSNMALADASQIRELSSPVATEASEASAVSGFFSTQ